MLVDVISGDRNMIKKEVEKILKYKDLTIENTDTAYMKCNNTNNTSNNGGKRNHLKIIQ